MSAPACPPIPADVDAFLQHWLSLGKRGLVPTLRAYLDAPPFKLQSEVAIVDVISPTDMRFRLFGTGLSVLAGNDLTGADVLSNFHPRARSEASRIAWTATQTPCGYIIRRDMRRETVDTSAFGIAMPLLHEQSGQIGLVGFSSILDKTNDIHLSGGYQFVHTVQLIQWINIGAGMPPA